MAFDFQIPSEVTCTLITAAGSLLTLYLSGRLSARNMQEAIRQMKLTWKREDVVSSEDEFAEMASAVSEFVFYNSETNQGKAIAKIAVVRSKESMLLGTILDQLYQSVKKNDTKSSDRLLSDAIKEKRRIRSVSEQ